MYMANTYEMAELAGRTDAALSSGRRELADAPIPAIERASVKFETTQNTEALLEKIRSQGKLDLLTNVAASGRSPVSQPPDAKLDTLSASIGERLVWLAGRIIWGFAAAAWLLVPYVALKLAGVPLPF